MATPGRAGITEHDKRAIERLAAVGLSKSAIAREVRVNRSTVDKYYPAKQADGKTGK